jgi:hypothetical protein
MVARYRAKRRLRSAHIQIFRSAAVRDHVAMKDCDRARRSERTAGRPTSGLTEFAFGQDVPETG